ncbi:uncharacterized protein LOC116143300 [Pistacia vera]|uniref:uncharacterized protein LOC116143300 n=1 Tax=Pistacia vera TaxID=55513 RepID=UPI001262EE81|nr:uncharacterized protein LOC116143300 [Pistacia vera]
MLIVISPACLGKAISEICHKALLMHPLAFYLNGGQSFGIYLLLEQMRSTLTLLHPTLRLDVYIYDNLMKRKLHASAKAFQAEGKVSTDPLLMHPMAFYLNGDQSFGIYLLLEQMRSTLPLLHPTLSAMLCLFYNMEVRILKALCS